MNPEEIKHLIEVAFSNIVSERRSNPDGWAFYFKEVRRGANSSRIARAVQSSAGSPTFFKLAVSARLNLDGEAVVINPNKKQVRELFRREFALWMEHFQ
jgi:hypothetical protein